MTPETDRREPRGSAAKRVGFLELFFDLVFVFAVTQLVSTLRHDHDGSGWAHAALLLWLVWWAWSQYAWAGNAIDLDHGRTRVAVLCVTAAMLLAAVALPDAFAPDGGWFALPYGVVRLVGLALYWSGLAGDPTQRAALRTYVPVATVSPLLVVVGGLLSPGVRVWCWTAAVLVDVVSVLAAGRGEFRIDPAHFAERHGLIVIIALGESVVGVGVTATNLEARAPLLGAVVAALALVAVLWWSYFDWVHAAVEHRLASEPDHRRRAHLARDLFTLGHLPIVAGTVTVAAAVEELLAHPFAPFGGFASTALGLGPALFLAGFVVGQFRATRQLARERAVAVVTVAAVGWGFGRHLDALATTALVTGVIVAALTVEAFRRRPAVPR